MTALAWCLDHPRHSAAILAALSLPAAVILVVRGVERAIGRGAEMGGFR